MLDSRKAVKVSIWHRLAWGKPGATMHFKISGHFVTLYTLLLSSENSIPPVAWKEHWGPFICVELRPTEDAKLLNSKLELHQAFRVSQPAYNRFLSAVA